MPWRGSCSLAAAAAAMVLGACHGEPMTRLRIGMNPWPGYAQLAVAVEAGLFAEHGIDAQLVEYASLHDLKRGFASGQIDVLPSTLVEVLELHGRDLAPEVVWILDCSRGGDVVVARGKAVDDLRGARIAYQAGTLGGFLLKRLCERRGLDEAEVTPVTMSQDLMVEAFAAGRIDAAISYPPHATAMRAVTGAAVVFSTRELPGEVIDIVCIDRRLLDADPRLLGRFHSAMAATDRYCTTARAAALRTMTRTTGMSEAEFVAALADLEIYHADQQAAWLQQPQRLRALAARILRTTGSPAQVPDFVLAADRRSPLLQAAAPR
ncbi:MAG: ABC transporter substrate-binding protein [Planctomycetes bacterium]|nr:ABC transporter substrate-binding protein [Planctomycetota bacterium]